MSSEDQLQKIREEQARRFAQQGPVAGGQPPQPAPQPAQQATAAHETEVDQHTALPAGGAPAAGNTATTTTDQPQQQRRDLIGLPGQDAFLTQAEIEQRQRAAEKNKELDDHNRAYDEVTQGSSDNVRAPAAGDQARRVRMVDDWRTGNEGEEAMPDLSEMLREAQEEMRAMGVNFDTDFNSMSDDIEREIDERLARDTEAGRAIPDAAGNVLQIFDAQGNDMVDPAGPDAEAMDPQNTGPRAQRTVDPRVFDNYSVTSTLSGAASLPAENKSCAICQEELKEGETVRRLKCLHVFHKECVDQWLQKEPKCPVCKMQFEEGLPQPEGPKGPA